jgi:hypothetical protein
VIATYNCNIRHHIFASEITGVPIVACRAFSSHEFDTHGAPNDRGTTCVFSFLVTQNS